MQVLYGIEGNYIDVTDICREKLIFNNTLKIPASDHDRSYFFGDPLVNILKHIKIGNRIYTHHEEIVLDSSHIHVNYQEKLKLLHSKINLDFGSMTEEYPEQLMAVKYIKPTDTVLEIGGNIGRNSCIIALLLNDDKRLLVLESSEISANQLKHNRNKNNLKFHVEDSALSKVPLIQSGWTTLVSKEVLPGYTKVKTITFDEILKKYQLKFNVLVADCEGALYQILKDEPDLLKDIETIIIENDFVDIKHKEYVHSMFLDNGFKVVYNEAGGWGPCYSCFFQVYKK